MSTLPKSAFQMLPLSRLHESPTNPRRVFDEAKLLELAASLKAQGLIQPIVARPNADGFEIVAGARRYRAAQLAEFSEIPTRVVSLTDEQALEWQLIELSIVGKSFLCLYAISARRLYVIDVRANPKLLDTTECRRPVQ